MDTTIDTGTEELLVIDESLDIASVATFREKLRDTLLTAQPKIHLVIDQLQTIDTAGLQLLLAFQKDVAARGKKLSISGNSTAFRTQTETLGLLSLFNSETDTRNGFPA